MQIKLPEIPTSWTLLFLIIVIGIAMYITLNQTGSIPEWIILSLSSIISYVLGKSSTSSKGSQNNDNP